MRTPSLAGLCHLRHKTFENGLLVCSKAIDAENEASMEGGEERC